MNKFDAPELSGIFRRPIHSARLAFAFVAALGVGAAATPAEAWVNQDKISGPVGTNLDNFDSNCVPGIQDVDFIGTAMSRDYTRDGKIGGRYAALLGGDDAATGRHFAASFRSVNSLRYPGSPYTISEWKIIVPTDMIGIGGTQAYEEFRSRQMTGNDVPIPGTDVFRPSCGSATLAEITDPFRELTNPR